MPVPPQNPVAILGRKVGMTRFFTAEGKNVPVTIVQAGPCFVSQIKTLETDGYNAVQLAYEEIKGRSSTFPVIAHDAKAGLAPMRFHREVRFLDSETPELEVGGEVTVDAFSDVRFVDVTATSKGKGFQGPMKRHTFKGQLATHGVERKHRSPGSIGGRSSNLGTGKPKKGIRMAGRMGNERVTTRSLEIVKVDAERGLLIIKGCIPGGKNGLVMVQKSGRLFKKKVNILNAAG